jgi:hypothetical protein
MFPINRQPVSQGATGLAVHTPREIKKIQELAMIVQIECGSLPIGALCFASRQGRGSSSFRDLTGDYGIIKPLSRTMLLANFAVADTTPTAPSQDVKLAGRSKPKPGNHDVV